KVSIGERRKPDPKGKPGYLRLDTVHQGRKDGDEGIFFINSVDTVTQWQNIGCVETISEQHMLPVLVAEPSTTPLRSVGVMSFNEAATCWSRNLCYVFRDARRSTSFNEATTCRNHDGQSDPREMGTSVSALRSDGSSVTVEDSSLGHVIEARRHSKVCVAVPGGAESDRHAESHCTYDRPAGAAHLA
ncbi:MAG: hypothetical protein ACRD7E_21855, partial [Bryobacteraceae bacterium]